MGGGPHDEDCVSRLVKAGLQGLLCGAFFGAGQQAFKATPTMVRQTTIAEAFRLPRQQAVLFGAASAVFATTECLANSISGEPKLTGTALGGLAMGTTVGIIKGNKLLGLQIAMATAAFGCGVEWLDLGNPLKVPYSERNLARWNVLGDKEPERGAH